jgi:hypothetical protein
VCRADAEPYYLPSYPAITPGGVQPYTVSVDVRLSTPSPADVEVSCDAFIAEGSSASYPRKWEVYDGSTYLFKYSTTLVGRCGSCTRCFSPM